MAEEVDVRGAAYLLIGSGCGRVLTKDQRRFLTTVNPEKWYPRAELLKILETAGEKDPMLLVATGRKWGTAMAKEFGKMGIPAPMAASKKLTEVYTTDHQGGYAGQVTLEEDGPEAIYLTNSSPYPNDVIFNIWVAMIEALGAVDVDKKATDDPERCYISWKMED